MSGGSSVSQTCLQSRQGSLATLGDVHTQDRTDHNGFLHSVSIQLPGLAEMLLWHLVFLYPEGLSGVLFFLLCLQAWSPKLFTPVVLC